MKTVLVTGGTGEIGSAICRKFAQSGFSVIATYNNDTKKAEKLKIELESISPTALHFVFQCANTATQKVHDLKQIMHEKYGKLDVLVNGAGITTPIDHADLESLTDEWIDKIFETNVRGSLAMIRAMKDLLQASTLNGNKSSQPYDPALIVNISSIAGVSGIGSNVAYCASKAALDSVTRSLGRALAPSIRVISVSPGWVEGEYTKNIDPDYLKLQTQKTPLNRLALAQDVAQATWAAYDSLKFSTGSIIPVDGGRLLGS